MDRTAPADLRVADRGGDGGARGPGRRRRDAPWMLHRSLSGVGLCVLVAAYLVAAYQPFRWERPWVPNPIDVTDEGGLSFDGAGRAWVDGPLPWVRAAIDGGGFILRMEARTDDPQQDGPARLLTVSADTQHADLTVGQAGDDLVVRLRRPGASEVGTPALVADDAFADPGWHDVEVRVDAGAVVVEVDDQLAVAEPLGEDPLRSWDGGFGLSLGDEVVGGRGWSGELRRATVTVGATTVDLLAPGAYELPSAALSKPLTEVIVEPSDVVLNLIGFVPFGAGYLLLRPGRPPVRRAVRASFLMSLVMEAGQLAVATRDPSVLDLALNTTGGAVGAVCLVVAGAARRRSRRRLSA